MKPSLFFIPLMILTVIVSACSSIPSTPGEYDALAECLTANGATMFGTEWCPHCKDQKAMFGTAFKLINYVDCDKYRNDCIAAGVEGYPTWKINNTLYSGTQNLYILASKSGCQDTLLATG
jgi:glutaredoxin